MSEAIIQCEGKVAYASAHAANLALRSRLARPRGRNLRSEAGRALQAYRCPQCADWHLGHGPR